MTMWATESQVTVRFKYALMTSWKKMTLIPSRRGFPSVQTAITFLAFKTVATFSAWSYVIS